METSKKPRLSGKVRARGYIGAAAQALWSYGSNNELLATDTASYAYDAAGNLIRRTTAGGEQRYIYDEQSRLMRVESGTGDIVAQYGYDPFGRRLWKEVGGTRTYFAYTGEGLAAELDASGTPIRTYGWEPQSGWMAAPMLLHDTSGYAYYHDDHLGTPQKLTDTAAHVVWSALYTAFGVAQPQIETVVNPLRFPGQYFDAETGLHQNFFRDYDPQLGRYIEPDPIGLHRGFDALRSLGPRTCSTAVANSARLRQPGGGRTLDRQRPHWVPGRGWEFVRVRAWRSGEPHRPRGEDDLRLCLPSVQLGLQPPARRPWRQHSGEHWVLSHRQSVGQPRHSPAGPRPGNVLSSEHHPAARAADPAMPERAAQQPRAVQPRHE